jgi:hypothetical protein
MTPDELQKFLDSLSPVRVGLKDPDAHLTWEAQEVSWEAQEVTPLWR